MELRLSDDDGRVVDLLLDGGISTPTGPLLTQVFSSPHPEMFEQRLESVERVLKLLDQYAVAEPPADLLSRTLDLIEQAQGASAGAAQPSAHAQTRPHA